ncbi:hypothetical protein BDV40DRAFT_298104 [Aspergillus tamarii]|uniref:Uncharacterized protein n=1 Tax=Aspergillus tamarii TaxID=41984 RepID=A0A5N6V1H5_ASPTM|nr:hypothetical protein BDV40DRAFT_298104 [Aspergillus tamarii]
MTENTFFDQWAGRKIDFPSFGPSTWTLTALISEKNTQEGSDNYWRDGCVGSAFGTFLCQDTANNNQQGVMKIIMQIPCEGPEHQPADMRARQASTSYENDLDITSQVYALEILTDHGCESTPGILARKEDLQKEIDLVPGGYIIYVLMNYLPGKQLSKGFFWNIEYSVREEIRQAFKTAWL